ncbi:acyl CoA binding protein-domain-containing protein [Jimgerdemannia flammicorona]|uniref:Acyl CoA binding protein-domain-containing protein n=1 Tax=Jimgerdemannia flammicorona TaxID=994334 RepID=A0A433CYE5_9FUNG|nr:acyl CoA binding protein-domain-containing protein [Jimgerdemannia flammicorona]
MSDAASTGNVHIFRKYLPSYTLAAFVKATEDVNKLTTKPTNEELLELYALFKQAIFGDNTTAKPGMFDPKGKYKWEAWTKKKSE